MWPIKRKKKSARKESKTVYFYPNDYIILKGISKDRKMSTTQAAHDMMGIYFGYKEGVKGSEIRWLTLQRNVAAEEMRKLRKELDIYIALFGKLPKSDSKQEKK